MLFFFLSGNLRAQDVLSLSRLLQTLTNNHSSKSFESYLSGYQKLDREFNSRWREGLELSSEIEKSASDPSYRLGLSETFHLGLASSSLEKMSRIRAKKLRLDLSLSKADAAQQLSELFLLLQKLQRDYQVLNTFLIKFENHIKEIDRASAQGELQVLQTMKWKIKHKKLLVKQEGIKRNFTNLSKVLSKNKFIERPLNIEVTKFSNKLITKYTSHKSSQISDRRELLELDLNLAELTKDSQPVQSFSFGVFYSEDLSENENSFGLEFSIPLEQTRWNDKYYRKEQFNSKILASQYSLKLAQLDTNEEILKSQISEKKQDLESQRRLIRSIKKLNRKSKNGFSKGLTSYEDLMESTYSLYEENFRESEILHEYLLEISNYLAFMGELL